MAVERVLTPPWGPEDEPFRESSARYHWALRLVTNKLVLDVACGSGFGSEVLRREAATVVGLDNSADAIGFATSHHHGPRFLRGDACTLPLRDEGLDVVISFETIEHLVDQERFVAEVGRVLKAGGLFVVSTPDREVIPLFSLDPNEYRNPFHTREFTRQEFEQLLSKYFGSCELHGQGLYRSEIPMQRRIRTVLRVLKRRFGSMLPEGLKKVVKSSVLGTGSTQAISRLGDRKAKYVIAICHKVPAGFDTSDTGLQD